MLLYENIKIATNAILTNKIRAFLTMLGIIIGVAAVITLMAMGEGVRKGVASEIESIGSNFIVVMPGKVSDGQNGGLTQVAGVAGISTITLDDRDAIRDNVDHIEKISAIMFVNGNFTYEDKSAVPLLLGSNPDLQALEFYNPSRGRFINDEDMDNKNKVVVLGGNIVSELFGDEDDPIGNKISINKEDFEVVGTMESESVSGLGIDSNTMAVIPISVSREMFDTDKVNRITAQINSKENIEEARSQIKELLLSRHEGKRIFPCLPRMIY